MTVNFSDETFSTFLPFEKIEDQSDGTLMVWGRATQEVGDSQGEIMDYQSSAPQFRRRAKETHARSNGQNLMPLRSMHQPIAAGKVVQFDFLDAEKAIDICSHVVDSEEVKKVKAGVYTGYSVGGKYLKRWPDQKGQLVRYTADPMEISLVDTPAVPTAKFTLFKADDIEKGGRGSGNFGHKGRPGQRGGSGDGSGGGAITADEFKSILADLFKEGDENGFSYNPISDQSPTSGYMSSEYPDRMMLMKTEDLTTDELLKFATANRDLLQDENHYLGGWAQKYGDVYLDISKRFDSQDEAIASAIAHHQAGIFDLNELKTVYTSPKFDPASPEFDKDFLDEFISAKKDIHGNAKFESVEFMKVIGDRVGIIRRNGSPSTPPQGYPSNYIDYGDPANVTYPVDASNWVVSVDRFNKGNDGEYSPREWHVLGRRITQLASRFTAHTYDPVMKKISRKEKVMSDNLNKMDVGHILVQLKAATGMALANAGADQIAKDALTAILGQLDDLSTPVKGDAAPQPANAESPVLKADGAPDLEGKDKPAMVKEDKKEHEEPDGDEAKEVPPEFAAKVANIEKAISDIGTVLGKLTEVMGKQATITKSAGQSPLNGLNSILNADPAGDPDVDNEIIKALDEGGPYAMQKALKAAAGSDEYVNGSLAYERVYSAIRKASYATLEKGGVVTQNRHMMKLYSGDNGMFS